MTHVQRPPTTTVATTQANNDARPRCDRRDFMPDLPENTSACDKASQQKLEVKLYVVQGTVAAWRLLRRVRFREHASCMAPLLNLKQLS